MSDSQRVVLKTAEGNAAVLTGCYQLQVPGCSVLTTSQEGIDPATINPRPGGVGETSPTLPLGNSPANGMRSYPRTDRSGPDEGKARMGPPYQEGFQIR
jgi:hypothetical protein